MTAETPRRSGSNPIPDTDAPREPAERPSPVASPQPAASPAAAPVETPAQPGEDQSARDEGIARATTPDDEGNVAVQRSGGGDDNRVPADQSNPG